MYAALVPDLRIALRPATRKLSSKMGFPAPSVITTKLVSSSHNAATQNLRRCLTPDRARHGR